jgi:hypothetical protein
MSWRASRVVEDVSSQHRALKSFSSRSKKHNVIILDRHPSHIVRKTYHNAAFLKHPVQFKKLLTYAVFFSVDYTQKHNTPKHDYFSQRRNRWLTLPTKLTVSSTDLDDSW